MPQDDVDISEYLSDQQKVAILDNRTANFAADAFSHELNKEQILKIDPNASTEEQDEALQTISSMIADNEAKRSEITGETLKDAIARSKQQEEAKQEELKS
jgi:hypothetical protein